MSLNQADFPDVFIPETQIIHSDTNNLRCVMERGDPFWKRFLLNLMSVVAGLAVLTFTIVVLVAPMILAIESFHYLWLYLPIITLIMTIAEND